MNRGWLLALALISCLAQAEQKQDFGEFVVHYSAQNSTELDPALAQHYGLKRDPRLAMVMVTVQEPTGRAVAATVTGQARNLLGQAQVLEMREVREPGSIYYLGLFSISNLDTQNFSFVIQPAGSARRLELRFSQQFFVD